MPYWYNTTRQMQQLLPLAEEREYWKQIQENAGRLRIWHVLGISYEPKTHIMLRYLLIETINKFVTS